MKYGITLIELLIVIALVGIISGVGWPALQGWNCKQEHRNDYEELNNIFEKARAQATSEGNSTLVKANRGLPSNGGTYSVYSLQTKNCSFSGSPSNLSFKIPSHTISNKSKIFGPAWQCFHADGSASASQALNLHQVQKECDGKTITYQTLIFGATGLFEKKIRKGSSWQDL